MANTADDQEREQGDVKKSRERTEATKGSGPAFAAAEAQMDDLSIELVAALPRGPGELVKCRHIYGNRYRCNWWGPQGTSAYDNPGMYGLMVTTHRVIRSQMLRVTKTAEGLVMDPDPRKTVKSK